MCSPSDTRMGVLHIKYIKERPERRQVTVNLVWAQDFLYSNQGKKQQTEPEGKKKWKQRLFWTSKNSGDKNLERTLASMQRLDWFS